MGADLTVAVAACKSGHGVGPEREARDLVFPGQTVGPHEERVGDDACDVVEGRNVDGIVMRDNPVVSGNIRRVRVSAR